jgi:hypothetical protein
MAICPGREGALIVGSAVASVAIAAVNFAKGKIGWGICALIGLLVLWVIALVAAIRLARPDSWWARRFYDEEKRAQAEERFREERFGSFEDGLESERRAPSGRHRLSFECSICGEGFESRKDGEHHVERLHPNATVAPSAAVVATD